MCFSLDGTGKYTNSDDYRGACKCCILRLEIIRRKARDQFGTEGLEPNGSGQENLGELRRSIRDVSMTWGTLEPWEKGGVLKKVFLPQTFAEQQLADEDERTG